MAIVHLITGDWQAYHEIQFTPNQSGQIMLIQTEWWLGIRWWMIQRKTHQERLFHKWPWRQKQWTAPPSLITSPSSSSPTPVIYHHSHDWLFYRFCFWLVWRILGYVTSGICEKVSSLKFQEPKKFWSSNSPRSQTYSFYCISAETISQAIYRWIHQWL